MVFIARFGLVQRHGSVILKEGPTLRRLYSTFAGGGPGAGLLLLRVAAGIGGIIHGLAGLRAGPPPGLFATDLLSVATGVLLLAGLWTPIAACLVVLVVVWNSIDQGTIVWACIFWGTMGAALALLGPGAWSVDARLFGWKRIDIRDRRG